MLILRNKPPTVNTTYKAFDYSQPPMNGSMDASGAYVAIDASNPHPGCTASNPYYSYGGLWDGWNNCGCTWSIWSTTLCT